MKRLRGLSVALAAVILLCVTSLPLHAVETVTCPRLVNPVTVGGKFTTPDEWADSAEVAMTTHPKQGQFPAEAYFRAKHDETYAYFSWDFPTDKSLAFNTKTGYGDEAYLIVDPNHDKSLALKPDDFMTGLRWTKDKHLSIYRQGWSGKEWQSSYAGAINGSSSVSSSPRSTTPHAVYELAVPMEYFQGSETVGLAAFVYDSEKAPYTEELWPSNFTYRDPVTWGDLTFPKEVETTQTSTSVSLTPTVVVSTVTTVATPSTATSAMFTETSTVKEAPSTLLGNYLPIAGAIAVIVAILAGAIMLRKKKQGTG